MISGSWSHLDSLLGKVIIDLSDFYLSDPSVSTSWSEGRAACHGDLVLNCLHRNDLVVLESNPVSEEKLIVDSWFPVENSKKRDLEGVELLARDATNPCVILVVIVVVSII